MNKDIIYREDAIRVINAYDDTAYALQDMHRITDGIVEVIESLPSADRPSDVDLSNVYSTAYKNGYEKGKAERPRGVWRDGEGEVVPFDGHGCVIQSAWCSECGAWLVGSDEYLVIGHFCPNCGADMRDESDE